MIQEHTPRIQTHTETVHLWLGVQGPGREREGGRGERGGGEEERGEGERGGVREGKRGRATHFYGLSLDIATHFVKHATIS